MKSNAAKREAVDPCFDDVPTISPVIGEGEDAHRLVRVGTWNFTAWMGGEEGEPRIRDVDLAERLGYARPRRIRTLIASLRTAGKLKDLHRRPARGRGAAPVMVEEYWLTEGQALKVIAKSETDVADAILDEMIRVYGLARRGLLPEQRAFTLSPEAIAMAILPVVAQVLDAALAPLFGRLAALEARLASSPAFASGVISPAVASSIKARLTSMAKILVGCGAEKTVRGARLRLEQQLRGAARWGGAGCVWTSLPLSREGDVMRELDVMERAATAVASALRASRQQTIPGTEPKPN
jgi:hypothetical protein